MDLSAIARAVFERHRLGNANIHGVTHWARVLENGRILAKQTGARPSVVELFALFHDSCRRTDGSDPGHGSRGAALALSLRGSLFDLSDEEFELLSLACALHTDGRIEADVTIQTCWDADRLDLGRAGIVVCPSRLCTAAARDAKLIAWANRRGYEGLIPSLVMDEWGFDPMEFGPGRIS